MDNRELTPVQLAALLQFRVLEREARKASGLARHRRRYERGRPASQERARIARKRHFDIVDEVHYPYIRLNDPSFIKGAQNWLYSWASPLFRGKPRFIPL